MQQRATALLSFFVATFLLLFTAAPAQAQDAGQARVLRPVQFDVLPSLQDVDVDALPPMTRDKYEVPNRQLPVQFLSSRPNFQDPALQSAMGQGAFNAPLQNFDGLDNDDNPGRITPPDPNIEVGEQFIVEMVNLVTAVYDKNGGLVMDAVPSNAFWAGFGGACENDNAGDPIVLYDQDADRWVLTQFAAPIGPDALQCIAISQTDDPTGAYFRYAYETPGNDYPKQGIGAEAYYLTYRDFTGGFSGMVAAALDRAAALAGEPDAAIVAFDPISTLGSLLPADIDGDFLDADTPHPFAGLGQDAVPIYELDPDFENPGNSTFELVADLAVDPFDSQLCNANRGRCIPQPGDGQDLEALEGNLMHRLALRDMGSYNAMVVPHTVDADGNGRAGVRWYEFRNDGGGWSVFQQGTYAPDDGENRFMPSIAMNADGAIALGYAVSSESTNPSIRYTGRPAGAPLGQMTLEEQSIFEATVPYLGVPRWGDYTAMVVDPSAPSTFWYNGEYAKDIGGTFNWGTRIASFTFDTNDDIAPGEITDLDAEADGQSVELTWTAPADDAGDPESGPVNSYDIRASTDGPIEDSLDFENAIPLENPPAPAEPGTEQTYTAQNLDFETEYWFVINAVDDNGNRTLSNSPSATTGPPPEIAVSPDEFDVTLEPFETQTEQLTVSNNGPSTLNATLFVDYAPEDDVMPEIEFFYTEDFARSDLAPSAGAAPGFNRGTAAKSGPGISPLQPVGSSAFGINASSENFSSFDLGEPENINVIAPAPTSGGFFGAGTIGPDPTVSYTINGQTAFRIDNFTGDATELGQIEGEIFNDISGLTYDPADGTYYAVDFSAETSRLYTIEFTDSSAVATTTVGPIDGAQGAIALAIAGDGNLYSYSITTDELAQIDKGTAETTIIGSIGFDANFGQGMSYDAETDELYMAAFNATAFQAELRAVDVSTGATTLIGPIGDGESTVQFGWIGTAVPEAAGYIALGQTEISVEPGSSEDVDVTFDASGLDEGTYNADVVVQSNDPDNSEVRVPATLTVEGGEAVLAVDPDALDFGEVIAGVSETQSFQIINDGNLDLTITDVSLSGDDDAFSVEDVADSLVVSPMDSVDVAVTFTPPSEGSFTATVNVESESSGSATVDLSGTGLPAPVIAVTPDSLSESLDIGQMATDSLLLSNEGGSALEYFINFDEDDDNPSRAEIAAPTSARPGSGNARDLASATAPSNGPASPLPLDAEDADYQLDDGTTENSLGLTSGGDVMWMNAFEAIDGSASIGVLYTAYGSTNGSGLPDNQPATAYVYEDPNDDGDPSDAELVTSVDFELQDPHTDMFTEVDMGGAEVDGVFFIAVLFEDHAAGVFPAPIDENSGSMQSSWIVGNGTGDFDAEDLTNNSLPPDLLDDLGFPGNWLLRADGGGDGGGGGGDFPDWISVEPFEGTLESGGEQELTVTYDADSLMVGTYTGDIEISSNDPVTPVLEVPVTLEVGAQPYPFELDPDEIELTIDLTEGDSTAMREVTVTNTTDEEQSFEVLAQSVSGNAPVFQNFRSEGDRLEFARRLAEWNAMAPSGPAAEPSLGAAPDRGQSAPDLYGDLLLEAEMGTLGYGTDVFGDLSGQFVQFDLTAPGNLTSIGDSPTAFAGDFAPQNEEVFYVIDDGNAFLSVDKETGETTEIGTATPNSGESWTELAGDPTSGTLYGSAGNISGSTLYTVDPETGEATEVASITEDGSSIAFVIGIALDGDGQMYGYEIVNDTWLEIDKESGEATTVGPIGFDANFAQGLDYELDSGTMYMAAYNNAGLGMGELRTVDLATGSTTLIGPLGGGDELGYLALESGGFMFINTDLLSGTLAPGGSVTFDVNFDASGLNAGIYEAEVVVVATDQGGDPQEEIPVTLEVLADPDAELMPLALDFGEVFVGADTTQQITLTNTGQDALEVSDIQLSPDVFSIADSVETSFTLEPGASETYTVTFAPDAVQEYDGTFTVVSDDPDGDVSATLEGEGIAAPAIAVEPNALEFQLDPGDMETQVLSVTNTGGNALTYAIMDTLVAFTPGDSLDGPEPNATFEDVLLEEDFNEGIPGDWTVVNAIEESVNWDVNTTWDDGNFTGGDGLAAAASSFPQFPDVNYDTRLVSPEITATAENFTLEFKGNYNNFISDSLTVDVSTDGGASWDTLAVYTQGNELGTLNGDGETVTLSLGEFVDEGDTFQVRWRYFDTDDTVFDWYAQVDDVVVSRELEFLAVNPSAGTIAPGETEEVDVSVDATGLPEGLYEVALNFTTNDPLNEQLTVPVDVFVGEGLGGGVVITPQPGPDSTRTVAPGTEFLVPIDVTSLDGLDVQSYQFTLTFASMLLEPVGIETEGTLSEDATVAVNTDVEGQISVAAADSEGDVPILTIEGEGTLIFVRLQATEELGTSELAFTSFLFNEGEPPAATETTSIEVGQTPGDVNGDGEVTAGDAALILDFVVGLAELDEEAIEAGDVSGNGTLTAFDASLVLDFVVGNIDCFPVEPDCEIGAPALAATSGASASGAAANGAQANAAQGASSAGELAWGAPRHSEAAATQGAGAPSASAEQTVQVPLVLSGMAGTSGMAGEARSVELQAELDLSKVSVEGVESRLPEGWQLAHHVSEDGSGQGTLTLAAAGATALPEGEVALLTLRWLRADGSVSDKRLELAGQASVNEAAAAQMAGAELSVLPEAFAVVGNAPNPFSRQTRILVDLPVASEITVEVFDVLGRRVLTLGGREMEAGSAQGISIDAARLASGTYLYRVTATPLTEGGEGASSAERQTETGRMVVVK